MYSYLTVYMQFLHGSEFTNAHQEHAVKCMGDRRALAPFKSVVRGIAPLKLNQRLLHNFVFFLPYIIYKTLVRGIFVHQQNIVDQCSQVNLFAFQLLQEPIMRKKSVLVAKFLQYNEISKFLQPMVSVVVIFTKCFHHHDNHDLVVSVIKWNSQ